MLSRFVNWNNAGMLGLLQIAAQMHAMVQSSVLCLPPFFVVALKRAFCQTSLSANSLLAVFKSHPPMCHL